MTALTTAYCIHKHQPVQLGIDFAELLHTKFLALGKPNDMRTFIQFLWSTALKIKGLKVSPPGFVKELCSMINEVATHPFTPFPMCKVADVL